MIKVLYLISQLVRGGAEQQLYNLLANARDIDAVVVSLTPGGYWAEPIRSLGVPVIELERRGRIKLGRLAQIRRLIQEQQPDVVHIFLDGVSGLYARLGAALARHPRIIVGQRSHPTYYRSWFRKLLPLLNRDVKLLVFNSHVACAYMVDHKMVPAAKTRVIPNGINLDRFTPAVHLDPDADPPWPTSWRGKMVVGTVGHLTAPKSPETFVRLAARLRDTHPNLRFALIGGGPLREQIEALVQFLDVSDILWMAGEQADIPALLRDMDIFVLTSLNEGTPNAVLEAMAAGLPCVVTNAGDCAQVVVEGETGYIVPVGDVEGLARQVTVLAETPGLRTAMGEQGRERVRQEFDLHVMVDRYTQLYAELNKG